MSESQVVAESVHADTHHKEINRLVCVCIDEGSAGYIYDWALNNTFDAKTDMVVLLNCRDLNIPSFPLVNAGGFVSDLDDSGKKASHDLLKKYAEKLKAQNFAVRAIALVGEPKVELVRKATELKADLLVMGSRQLGSIKRVVLGSTSDYINHHSPCTTITVRPHPDHPEGKHQRENIFERKEEVKPALPVVPPPSLR